jgi:hypothetical protein
VKEMQTFLGSRDNVLFRRTFGSGTLNMNWNLNQVWTMVIGNRSVQKVEYVLTLWSPEGVGITLMPGTAKVLYSKGASASIEITRTEIPGAAVPAQSAGMQGGAQPVRMSS